MCGFLLCVVSLSRRISQGARPEPVLKNTLAFRNARARGKTMRRRVWTPGREAVGRGCELRGRERERLGEKAFLDENLLDAAVLHGADELVAPVGAQDLAGHLDDDVLGVHVGALLIAGEALQAAGARGEHLDVALDAGLGPGLLDLLELAVTHLGGDVGALDGEEARLATAALGLHDVGAGELLDRFERRVEPERRVARIVVEVRVGVHGHGDAALEQELVDVDDAAAREDAVELVLVERLDAGAAAHDDGLDVEVVERVGHAVEEHAVLRHHLLGLGGLAVGELRVAAAAVARREHGLDARVHEHRLDGEAHVAEEAFGAAAREVEDGLGVGGHVGTPKNRDRDLVLDAERGAHGLSGHAARKRRRDEMDHLVLEARTARGVGGLFTNARKVRGEVLLGELVAEALQREARANGARVERTHGDRVDGVDERAARERGGIEIPVARAVEEGLDGSGHFAEVDLDGAGLDAAVADRAVVGQIDELVEVLERKAAAGLRLIEEGFRHQPEREDLVARRVEHVGARDVRRADGLALAAA